MGDLYKVYGPDGKSLTGKDSVDRETAKRIYDQARDESRGSGSKPVLQRVGEDKPGPGESD